MDYRLAFDRRNWLLELEALTSGVAYGAGLCWASVCLLASFRPADLNAPYWTCVPALRSDTSGILAFFSFAACFSSSEFLRLHRRRTGAGAANRERLGGVKDTSVLAVSETVAVLATGLVIYLSVNTVTHPATLSMQATHLTSWPTEGTLRVIALLLCVLSVSILRFLLANRPAVLSFHPGLGSGPPDATRRS